MNENVQVLELDLILDQISKHASFSLGKEIVLRQKPQSRRLLIQRNNDRMRDALLLTVRFGGLPFSGIKDIRDSLIKAKKGGLLTIEEAVWVSRHGHGCENMKAALRKTELSVPFVFDLVDSLLVSLSLSRKIDACFSPNYEVLDTASSLLKEIRGKLRKMDAEISRQIQKFISTNADRLTDQLATYRHDRLVVPVRISDKYHFKGVIHGESASGQTAYIEPEFLLNLNNEKQSLISKEEDEIERICWEISTAISSVSEQYIANVETLGELDALFAKAQWGKNFDATVGTLSDDGLVIEFGRHPLIDRKQVIANTYRLQQPYRMLLITGPNTGGKTVSLKVIGLFTLMFYCGIPLPCENAKIPLFDEIYVDIGDEQSIAQSLSTFSSHLARIARITRHCTKDSLILLDELGGGTDPNEGESLAIAILEYLRNKQASVVATTHYNRLKSYGALHSEILLASVQFDLDQLRPTYKYIEGLAGQSYALDIALRFELDEQIVSMARQLKEEGKSEVSKILEKLEIQLDENRKIEENLGQQLAEAKVLEAQLNKQLSDFERSKHELFEKARVEANLLVEEALIKTEEYLELLKSQEKPHQRLEIKKQLEELIDQDEELEIAGAIAVDDTVRILSTSQVGIVSAIDRNQYTVEVLGKSFKVNKKQIMKIAAVKKKAVRNVSAVSGLMAPVSMECNVIGMRVEEALPVVEKYIDDCLLRNLKSVRIVHGHGTGALRKAIWARLNNHSSVEELRLGGQGEGGGGATVVMLKGR
jgi:DNA mismatch repair protein MutS2